jgi:hypothetical protein
VKPTLGSAGAPATGTSLADREPAKAVRGN